MKPLSTYEYYSLSYQLFFGVRQNSEMVHRIPPLPLYNPFPLTDDRTVDMMNSTPIIYVICKMKEFHLYNYGPNSIDYESFKTELF